jgi:hypothetical protein
VTSRTTLARKQRYADDPEYRERILAYNRAWRLRRAEDPEYRERIHAYYRAWSVANRDKINAQRRRRRADDPDGKTKQRKALLKYSYGLTVDDYDAMLARQGGACAICRKKPASTLCVDQRHWQRGVTP